MKYIAKKSIMFLMLAVTITLVVAPVVAHAKKHLICPFDLYRCGIPGFPEMRPDPELGTNTWWGPIGGDIEGYIYFYKTDGKNVGQSRHFVEVWWITDEEGNMLLWGTDKGAFCPLKNPKYRMSGVVRYAAPEYEHLIGRNMYISGEVDLAKVPPEAPGIFRVN